MRIRDVLLGALVSYLIIQNVCVANASRVLQKSQFFANFLQSNNNGISNNGTKWAVLVAGSNGWGNYRHQADVCHAYQILKKSGMKDENIIVFMYDDIANSPENPHPGIIINSPNGSDVYHGVPKDYTGENVTVNNLFAAILGNKSGITGGSGKVVESGPDDYIFIYYTDHGGAGVVGSMFQGLLPSNINVYATTASNATEDSWAEYCPNFDAPLEYDTCLGDLYSISWLEDCDMNDVGSETLQQQYESVRKRTLEGTAFNGSSHVMQYGDMSFSGNVLSVYLGDNPSPPTTTTKSSSNVVPQRDAALVHLHHKIRKSDVNSEEYLLAKKKLSEELAHREHVDYTINQIGKLLLGHHDHQNGFKNLRSSGQPLVDDWDCLKTLVKTYAKYCGSLSTYGLKYTGEIANACNAGITVDQFAAASIQTCS
uniref:Legumain prodomain domain-containing protein n=1 Tax=Cannabis sativa TaxID=3483 RepID=A0A803PBB8_CANSA